MSPERRPNRVQVRYDRKELLAVLDRAYPPPAQAPVFALDEYERLRAEGKDKPCQSVIHHGPGHQSTTYCQVTGGDAGHDQRDGVLVHEADLPSGGFTEWTDDRPYAEYWG